MQTEFFDILDERGEKTGEKRERAEAHRLGLLHRAVHVWVVNDRTEVLLQKRADTLHVYPGKWDISVGGHVSAGETSIEAALKESEEELGLQLSAGQLTLLATLRQETVLRDGAFVDREFQDVYVVRIGASSLVKPNAHEVQDVRWLDVDAFAQWIRGEGEEMVPHPEEYARIAAFLRTMQA